MGSSDPLARALAATQPRPMRGAPGAGGGLASYDRTPPPPPGPAPGPSFEQLAGGTSTSARPAPPEGLPCACWRRPVAVRRRRPRGAAAAAAAADGRGPLRACLAPSVTEGSVGRELHGDALRLHGGGRERRGAATLGDWQRRLEKAGHRLWPARRAARAAAAAALCAAAAHALRATWKPPRRVASARGDRAAGAGGTPLSADFVRRIDDDQMSLHRGAPRRRHAGLGLGRPPRTVACARARRRGRPPRALAGDDAAIGDAAGAAAASENQMTRQARDDLQLAQRLGEEELVAHRAAPPPPPGGEEKEVKVAMRTPPPPPPLEPVQGPSEMALRRLSGATVSHGGAAAAGVRGVRK